jgi:hypothetical protein
VNAANYSQTELLAKLDSAHSIERLVASNSGATSWSGLNSTHRANAATAVTPIRPNSGQRHGRRSGRYSTIEIRLNGNQYPLPLGWRLSAVTQSLIQGQSGKRERCMSEPAERAKSGSVDCARAKIYDQLRRGPQ